MVKDPLKQLLTEPVTLDRKLAEVSELIDGLSRHLREQGILLKQLESLVIRTREGLM